MLLFLFHSLLKRIKKDNRIQTAKAKANSLVDGRRINSKKHSLFLYLKLVFKDLPTFSSSTTQQIIIIWRVEGGSKFKSTEEKMEKSCKKSYKSAFEI